MSKKLSLQKETLVSLQEVDLDQVYGGVAAVPTSSAKPGPVAHPTSTAVTGGHTVSSVFKPTSTAVTGGHTVSSVRPPVHHHHHQTVSSVRPGGGTVSSVKPNW